MRGDRTLLYRKLALSNTWSHAKIATIHVLQHGQMRPHLESGFPPSPSWEAGDCSHPPPMAHRDYAGNIRSPHDDTPLCHQWQVILHTSDIVGRFDAFYRPSHSVSYQIYTGFYCVLFSLHTQLFILGFLLLLTRWKWSIYRICVWQLPNRNRAQSSVTCGYA